MPRALLLTAILAAIAAGIWGTRARTGTARPSPQDNAFQQTTMTNPYFGGSGELPKTESDWKKVLTPEQFRVARQHGTERAFTGQYWQTKEPGLYRCVCCGQPLFSSDEKYDSGTGWPSFWQPVDQGAIGTKVDRDFFASRVEIHCSRCQAHLGHVFDDGPEPTGLRYCVNSASLVHESRPQDD